jgi:hypothetical protein
VNQTIFGFRNNIFKKKQGCQPCVQPLNLEDHVSVSYIPRNMVHGRAIAQAVNRRLPIAAVRVQTRVWSCGILWWTKVALGQVFFSENFGFPCQSTFHLLLLNHLHYHPRLAQ